MHYKIILINTLVFVLPIYCLAADEEGVKVSGSPGFLVNSSGRAEVPYLTSYALNQISIDPKLSLNYSLSCGFNGFDQNGNQVGYFVQNGRIYARVEGAQGHLTAKWKGDGSSEQCTFSYVISPEMVEKINFGLSS